MPKLIQNSSTTKKIDIFTKDDVLKKCLLCHENMDLDSSREILDARWHYSECYFNRGSFMKKYPPVNEDLDKNSTHVHIWLMDAPNVLWCIWNSASILP